MGVGWEGCVQAGGMVHGIHVYPALMQNKGVLSHVGTGTRINASDLASPQSFPRVAWTFVTTLEFHGSRARSVCILVDMGRIRSGSSAVLVTNSGGLRMRERWVEGENWQVVWGGLFVACFSRQ